MRARVLVLLFLVFTLSGCGGAPAPEPNVRPHFLPPPPAGYGSLDIDFHDNLPWPYRVTRILCVLDGAVLYKRRDAELDFEPVTNIARLTDLPHGDHTLQLLVGMQYPSGSLDDRFLLELRTANSFSLNREHAEVVLDAHAGDVTREFSERVRIDVRVR